MHDGDLARYQEGLRHDFYAFTERGFAELNPHTQFRRNWHIEVICATLEAVAHGKLRRVIINVPPRSLKSHCASIAFPAWLLGHNPSAQILAVSYGQDLSDKFARDCRTLMSSQFYMTLFSARVSPQKHATAEFETTAHGYRLATSVGGVLTGRGADIIIIDDPMKPDEAPSEVRRKAVNDFYDATLYSRQNDKANTAIVLIMQRLHEDDLVGHVLGQEPWTVLRFPAIGEEDEIYSIDGLYGRREFRRRAGEPLHADRESLATLDGIRQTLGSYNFAAQYQQSPAPLGGGIIRAEWFGHYDPAELPDSFDLIVQSWDTAAKANELSDYTVCTTWGQKGPRIFLLHVLRKRLDYPELKRAVREQWQAFGSNVILIEDKSSGMQLLQELKHEGLYAATAYEPEGDKLMRMTSQTVIIENGFLSIPREAHWLADYLHELTSFPYAKYKDQVDSTSQALHWFNQRSLNSCQGWLNHYKRLAMRATGRQQERSFRVKPPLGSSNNHYFGNGPIRTLDLDGTLLVSEEHLSLLLKAGWTVVN
jgi:predicted phage terminase large subunit-like protein